MRNPSKLICAFIFAAAGSWPTHIQYTDTIGNWRTQKLEEHLGHIIGIRGIQLKFNNKEQDSGNYEDLPKHPYQNLQH